MCVGECVCARVRACVWALVYVCADVCMCVCAFLEGVAGFNAWSKAGIIDFNTK